MTMSAMVVAVRHGYRQAKEASPHTTVNFTSLLLRVVREAGYKGEDVGVMMAELAAAYAEDKKRRRAARAQGAS